MAKPNTKVEATVNNRDPKGGAKKKTDIWDIDEVKEIIVDKEDKRIKPEFDV
jgi:hypothetical protein